MRKPPPTPPRARHSAMRRMARALLRGASISAPSVPRRAPRSRARAGSARNSASASSSAASPAPPTPADVLGATERWIDESVVGLNLCPFARAPRASDGIRIVVSEARDYDPFFDEFRREAQRLALTYTDADHAYDEDDEDDDDAAAAAAADPAPEDARSSPTPSPEPRWAAPGLSEPSTTLIVAPYVADIDDFLLFLAVVERCEAIVDELDLSGYVQLATFHPEYQFAGEEVADPGSYTNRSPYPTVHLLRVVDVSRAVDAHPDPESIPEANVDRLRGLGRKTLHDRLKALVAWRAPRG